MSITSDALLEALDTMQSMIVNPGQQSVFDKYISIDFKDTYSSTFEDPCEGWEEVDAGDYVDFMGEICEAGNSIMIDAYDYACEVQYFEDAIY